MTKKQNASQYPKIYFGLHFCDGIAQYEDQKRIFINEKTARKMNETFCGKPVFVKHADVDLPNLQAQADGYVIRSFLNQADGKHWAEFMVVSDDGQEAIKKGWRLSNAYIPSEVDDETGKDQNGVPYDEEILDAEYEHLAIVPNPRYAESVILTPEQFEKHNESFKIQSKRYINDKGDTMGLSLFKKEKVKNADDLAGLSVTLPKSKVDKTFEQIVNDVDQMELDKAKPADEKMADLSAMVEVEGLGKISVADLIEKYKAEKADNEDAASADEEVDNAEPKQDDKKVETEEEKKAKEDKKEKAKAENSKVKNAKNSDSDESRVVTIDTSIDQITRGKNRYGSK